MSLESIFERIAVALETIATQKSGMTTATYENTPQVKVETKAKTEAKAETKVEPKAKPEEKKAKQEEPGLTYAVVKQNFLNLLNAIVAKDGMAAAKARAKMYLNIYAAGAPAISEKALDKDLYEEFNTAVLEDLQELEVENG